MYRFEHGMVKQYQWWYMVQQRYRHSHGRISYGSCNRHKSRNGYYYLFC
jgi:hypothetical protein